MAIENIQTRIPGELREKIDKIVKEENEKNPLSKTTTSSVLRYALEKLVEDWEDKK